MSLLTVYLLGAFMMLMWAAIRDVSQGVRPVAIICAFWPLSLVVLTMLGILWAIGWDFDVQAGTKRFGIRKPTNPEVRGFAIILFKLELQFWRLRK